jgi:hypothetical protein
LQERYKRKKSMLTYIYDGMRRIFDEKQKCKENEFSIKNRVLWKECFIVYIFWQECVGMGSFLVVVCRNLCRKFTLDLYCLFNFFFFQLSLLPDINLEMVMHQYFDRKWFLMQRKMRIYVHDKDEAEHVSWKM